MKKYAYKIGAAFYVLWGLLHVAGASLLLMQGYGEGATAMLATIASGVHASAIPALPLYPATAVLAYYAWNLLWIGTFVMVVGGWLNWKNSRTGYWINLVVVSAVDTGLLILLVAPGYMALTDGMLGVLLWIPAVVFSTIGIQSAPVQAVERAMPA